MYREVRVEPNPILHVLCKKIRNIDGVTKSLISCMMDTMYFSDGIGLAANQIGYGLQIAVVTDISKIAGKPFILINPVVKDSSLESVKLRESCLSIPDKSFDVYRFNEITVKYQDEYGKFHTTKFEGFQARIVQHELDHLNGYLISDRGTPISEINIIQSNQNEYSNTVRIGI